MDCAIAILSQFNSVLLGIFTNGLLNCVFCDVPDGDDDGDDDDDDDHDDDDDPSQSGQTMGFDRNYTMP